MVTQSLQNWAGPVEFDPGQVKIMIDYTRGEIFWTFLGDEVKILVWSTETLVTVLLQYTYLLWCLTVK